MKTRTTILVTLLALVALSAGCASQGHHLYGAQRAVTLAITNDLVKDFPIALTATTYDDDVRVTIGPTPIGGFAVFEAKITRFSDGRIKITGMTVAEEVPYVGLDKVATTRNTGFEGLTVILSPGEEATVLSLNGKSCKIKLVKTP